LENAGEGDCRAAMLPAAADAIDVTIFPISSRKNKPYASLSRLTQLQIRKQTRLIAAQARRLCFQEQASSVVRYICGGKSPVRVMDFVGVAFTDLFE